ncbi:MAG: ribosome biogenesis GTPase Der [Anaerostipes sp.]|uniref:ribosome biogenesis GTPase Der n=1 Tax=Anaerostipes sp. 992a TaxID=1261637 RepID=UPI00095241C4|nr:ribosome biogenesis GTPase Der [Anaerostipes sp. 992a]MCI5952198.1 ribosome biogenesis GTPase Der [Anaerostipes sp.]MDD5968497.1 ribosome biogenesis GTPase Der [Anaerostipes sp.]OLR63837.1 ribosome biogenesis GTPase Der [Anaerostipes sp. 992a]
MSKPMVAIVGRPNVGKSTLFNALAGEQISIVKDTPGVTRDRIFADITWLDKSFTMVDTGGIEPESDDLILSRMREQAEIAIATADVIIFLVDVRQGLVDADFRVADMLRRSRKPIVLVVNKVDNFDKFMPDVYEFYNLGLGDPIPVSGASRLGLGDMLDEVLSHCREEDLMEEEDDRPKIAIIGKPNSGKSSIINKMLGEERVIVSNIAGTTRDAIDTVVSKNGKEYVFIDTAGLRRKSKIKEEIERYSIIRTVAAVERCDVAMLVIDAEEGVTEQDAKIAGIAHERGKGVIIAVNKWDLIEKDDKTIYKFTNKVRETLAYMPYAELIFISAKTGQRFPKIFDLIDTVVENCTLRIQTGVLNEILAEAVAMKQPPSDKGKRLRLYYITQVSVKPPTFVVFINDKKLMHFSYTRYIENQIRQTFGFRGTPIRIIARERKEK